MPYEFVTCPESAHLELLEYELHPLGMLVIGCSRFRPACRLQCTRVCAALLDRRDRRDRVRLDAAACDAPTRSLRMPR